MKRRDFIFTSSALLVGSMATRVGLHAQTSPTNPAAPAKNSGSLVPLRRNVGYFQSGTGSTIGWLASPDALVAVDSYFPKGAVELLSRLPGRAGREIDVLFNSHHHPDHVGGNSTFRPVTKKIVAQQQVPALQLAQAEERNTVSYQIYADTLYSDQWRIEAGDEVVTAKFVGYAAHTQSDSILHFEKANVVHLADLVFNRYYPMTDRPGGCVIRAWIKALEQVVKDYPADAIYIFGHAKKDYSLTGGHPEILAQRDYLTGLLEFTEAAIKSGKSRDEHIGVQEIPGFPEWRAPQPNFIARNLAAAWDELTGVESPRYTAAPTKIYNAK